MKPVRLAAILILGVTMLASLGASADEPSTRPEQTVSPPLPTAAPVGNAVQLGRAVRPDRGEDNRCPPIYPAGMG